MCIAFCWPPTSLPNATTNHPSSPLTHSPLWPCHMGMYLKSLGLFFSNAIKGNNFFNCKTFFENFSDASIKELTLATSVNYIPHIPTISDIVSLPLIPLGLVMMSPKELSCKWIILTNRLESFINFYWKKCWHCFMASFMVSSSSSEFVIDFACYCGWWRRQATAVCVSRRRGGGVEGICYQAGALGQRV